MAMPTARWLGLARIRVRRAGSRAVGSVVLRSAGVRVNAVLLADGSSGPRAWLRSTVTLVAWWLLDPG
jgi:hypothetical protein